MQQKQYIALPIEHAEQFAKYLALRPWVEANPLLKLLEMAQTATASQAPQSSEPAFAEEPGVGPEGSVL